MLNGLLINFQIRFIAETTNNQRDFTINPGTVAFCKIFKRISSEVSAGFKNVARNIALTHVEPGIVFPVRGKPMDVYQQEGEQNSDTGHHGRQFAFDRHRYASKALRHMRS